MAAFKTLWNALMLVRKCDAKSFWLKLCYVLLGSLLPLANLVVLKQIIDHLTYVLSVENQGDWTYVPIAGYSVLFCAIFLLNRLVSVLDGVNNDVLSQRLIDAISERLHHQSATLDMAYYDNPEFHDTFHRAQQEANYRPIQILNYAMSLIGSTISIAGIIAMLVMANWMVIVIMIVSVVPSLLVRVVKARRIYQFHRDHTQDYRRTNYYSSLLTHRNFAKEMRLFGLSTHFRERFVRLRKQLVRQLLKISRRVAIFQDDVLFYCTVEENISFGDIERMGSPEMPQDVRQAASMAGAESIVAQLPEGYGTQLGKMFDGGVELSMGQWQRIALARLLYSQSPVMVFDEPTAWMDTASRSHFYSTIEDMKHKHLIIMISQ